ncbi:uncharacterized protein LOC115734828 [Rhodamnia argentea]|uniref:Uncharacterized protein LOC115734828 n=1 Tax=Rhodamnia argentea TaxID=178133 RepID=A0A8B8NHV7_9MYRT|nr:uncharacterized protein LOC115734828 [Rhodamnia argentea]XP_048139048.1 uncharacterized protein LOC115734828 [Rhodamnia argentea]
MRDVDFAHGFEKRERRPNVRLGDLGDFPAAFACVFSHKHKENRIRKRRNSGFRSLDEPGKSSVVSKETLLEEDSSDLGRAVLPGILVDPLRCRGNEKRDSSKPTSEAESLGEMGTSKCELNFGAVTRKCRVMKRRCRSAAGSNRVFASGWGFTRSPEIADALDGKGSAGFAKCFAPDVESDDMSGRETSMASKKGTEDGNVSPNAGHGHGADVAGVGLDGLSRVREWLEESGFGNYADVFEMHEVDEEALPLLTFRDLKEMGVQAVGPRRKLYSVIKRLAGDSR